MCLCEVWSFRMVIQKVMPEIYQEFCALHHDPVFQGVVCWGGSGLLSKR